MHIGIWSRNLDYGTPLVELARASEVRGFESLWVGEHTHIPATSLPNMPPTETYQRDAFHTLDPFVSLMAAASVTSTIKLGTAACLVTTRDPIIMARMVSTLDMLSNGRLILGVGAGWVEEEIKNHNVPWERRKQVLYERVTAMKAIWTQEEASYHGEFVNFERILSYPKPIQKPHPPVLLAAHGPKSRLRAAREYDGWFPVDAFIQDLPTELEDLRHHTIAAGRDPAAVSVTIYTWDELTEERAKRYRDLGVERIVVAAPVDNHLPFLDQTAEVMLKIQ